MPQSQEMGDKHHRLANRVSELENEKIKLQSDIYDLKMRQSRMHRDMENIVSYLEAQASEGGG